MSALDYFFDSEKITRVIPCTVTATPNLRKAAQDCSPEAVRAKVNPATGIVRIYTDTDSIYLLDCSTREGDQPHAISEVLIGAGFCDRPPYQIPDYLTDKRAAKGAEYWVERS